MSDTHYDIAIVGYGPVGAIFANLLTRYGFRMAVVEQATTIYDKPRAITLDHEALRVLQSIGLAEFLETRTGPHNGTHFLGIDGEVIKKFDPMPPPWPLAWIPTATFVQPELETALRQKLATYDRADVFLSTQAIGVAQDETIVSLTLAPAQGDEARTITARYLVACDGANSLVRRMLDIGIEDLAFDEWWMVVDTLAGDLARRPVKSFQYCRPWRPGTYVPGPRNLRRWEIKLLPGEDPAAFGAPENVRKLLSELTDISDLEIWRTAVYRFHALVADRWNVGRIFMMGDAVHQTPPFLGQGLCAGIRDAVNLAWKLAFVIQGKADASLFDTYEAERKPHVRKIVAAAKEFGTIIGELDLEAAKARDKRLRAELESGTSETIRQKFIPDLADGLIAKGAKLAGSLFVQPHIRREDGTIGRADDALPPEFLIVSDSPEILEEVAQDAGLQRVLITAGGAVAGSGTIVLTETEGLFANWLRDSQVKAVVVRPDRYVFGGANDVAELGGLVAQLGTMLASR